VLSLSKTITDPLYGSVGLTKLEANLVSSRTFQRLHNVRQLGLAHLVFPSAGYSRFAHSIGACHNAARMVDALKFNSPGTIKSEDAEQAYRIAALLHDVGHYPFSHATEHGIQDYYASRLLTGSPLIVGAEGGDAGLDHESVGRLVLELDDEIDKVFRQSGFPKALVTQVFSKSIPDPLFGIISSELDCDRLDYLNRTAYLSGAPFGSVDIEFIISQATAGPDGVLAFNAKAARAIDHLLISRFYDYMQVAYHKTVAALEWSLQQCINAALERKEVDLSSSAVRKRIERGRWWKFDDNFFMDLFKDLNDRARDSAGGDVLADHLAGVLYRRPAKQVWSWECFASVGDKQMGQMRKIARHAVAETARELGLDPSRFNVMTRSFPLTKAVPDAEAEGLSEEAARSVVIMDGTKPKLLINMGELIIHQMAFLRLFAVKVLYLPKEGESKEVRQSIRKRLADACES
jgi:HD superfamily phosphohydrolase